MPGEQTIALHAQANSIGLQLLKHRQLALKALDAILTLILTEPSSKWYALDLESRHVPYRAPELRRKLDCERGCRTADTAQVNHVELMLDSFLTLVGELSAR